MLEVSHFVGESRDYIVGEVTRFLASWIATVKTAQLRNKLFWRVRDIFEMAAVS
jgi:hypothetical protein